MQCKVMKRRSLLASFFFLKIYFPDQNINMELYVKYTFRNLKNILIWS